MSLSSVVKRAAVSLSERPSSGPQPRVFGGAQRLLRVDQVGVQRPISISAPVSPAMLLAQQELIEEQIDETPPPPPPDFVALEEAARLQGYNTGYEQGLAEGRAAAEADMAEAIQRMQQLASNVLESHTGFFRAAERQVVDLALQIAQKVVERELENMPELAVGVIRSALEEMDARTAVRVRIHPDDEEVVRRRWSQVVPSGVNGERIEIQPDERVQPGGAIIETTQGQVDAQLDTKLAQLGNALWTFVMDVDSQTDSES
jgi:flagellar biosynthesis/type III secretory pathway protein FliH